MIQMVVFLVIYNGISPQKYHLSRMNVMIFHYPIQITMGYIIATN